jgi:hypothetical protein
VKKEVGPEVVRAFNLQEKTAPKDATKGSEDQRNLNIKAPQQGTASKGQSKSIRESPMPLPHWSSHPKKK